MDFFVFLLPSGLENPLVYLPCENSSFSFINLHVLKITMLVTKSE